MKVIKKTIACFIAVLFVGVFGLFLFRDNAVPTVSVVMPTYNRADFLPRAIESVLNQTYRDFELVIVDDCSTDNTADILKNYFEKYHDKIKVVTHKTNQGVSAARNTGNAHARGKYIAVLDSDDYALPHFLSVAVAFMENNPDATIGIPVKHAYREDPENPFNVGETWPWHYPAWDFLDGNHLGNVGNIFVRSFVVKNKIEYNPSYTCAEDYDFWVHMILKGATVAKIRTSDPLVVFRSHRTVNYGGSCTLVSRKIVRLLDSEIGYERGGGGIQALPSIETLVAHVSECFFVG